MVEVPLIWSMVCLTKNKISISNTLGSKPESFHDLKSGFILLSMEVNSGYVMMSAVLKRRNKLFFVPISYSQL